MENSYPELEFLETDKRVALIELCYLVLDDELSISEGASQIWRLADDFDLLRTDLFDPFLQCDAKTDKADRQSESLLAGNPENRTGKGDELISHFRSILLYLREPFCLLQSAAASFMEGQLDAHSFVVIAREQVNRLRLAEQEPYRSIWLLADDFEPMPDEGSRSLFHPDLLERKQRWNDEAGKALAGRLRSACEVILKTPSKIRKQFL